MMTDETAIIGAGSWGTTLAVLLARKGIKVKLWVYEAELVEAIENKRENTLYLPGFEIPQIVKPSGSLEEVVAGCRVILNVMPSHVVRGVMSQLSSHFKGDEIVVNTSKGIENETLMTMDELLREVTPPALHRRLSFLSGPTFAKEVAAGKPAAASVASKDDEAAKEVQELLSDSSFRLYTNPDVVGVVLGGAFKNVIAVAAGILDGLELGDNTRAALITRGLAEMTRLGVEMGADPATFSGLSGIGDLVLTCSSNLSRNHTVGYKLGQGQKLRDILSGMKMVAEGVKTAKSIMGLSEKHGVELPISQKTYSILYMDEDPKKAVMELMTRSLKGELD